MKGRFKFIDDPEFGPSYWLYAPPDYKFFAGPHTKKWAEKCIEEEPELYEIWNEEG